MLETRKWADLNGQKFCEPRLEQGPLLSVGIGHIENEDGILGDKRYSDVE